MKQLILSVATILLLATSAFATGNDEVNKIVRQSFQRDFSTAHNIRYEKEEDGVKITFSIDEQVFFAYYNNDGDLLAIIRNIASTQLPISLLIELKKKYSDYWITELFEIVSDNRTAYYITVENMDRKVVLTSDDAYKWEIFSKKRKEGIN